MASCAGCHKLTDPLGLGFEQFDGIGQFRTVENEVTIDPSGDLDGVGFADGRSLAQAVSEHPDVPACLTNRLFSYALGRPTTRDERDFISYLGEQFAGDDYSVIELLRVIASSDAFYRISALDAEPEAVLSASVNDSSVKERGS